LELELELGLRVTLGGCTSCLDWRSYLYNLELEFGLGLELVVEEEEEQEEKFSLESGLSRRTA